jgi:hypothetical protein
VGGTQKILTQKRITFRNEEMMRRNGVRKSIQDRGGTIAWNAMIVVGVPIIIYTWHMIMFHRLAV